MLCVGKDSAKDLAGMNYAATCRRNMQILIGIREGKSVLEHAEENRFKAYKIVCPTSFFR